MSVFVTAVSLFIVAWVLHIAIWKVRLPVHHIRALLIVYGLVAAIWVIASAGIHFAMVQRFQIVFLYGVASLCYVITYSAIEGDSPTLSLMRLLHLRGEKGLPVDEVAAFLAQRPFVKARIAALELSGLLREQDGNYVVAGKPSLFFSIILGYRKLYGPISKGG